MGYLIKEITIYFSLLLIWSSRRIIYLANPLHCNKFMINFIESFCTLNINCNSIIDLNSLQSPFDFLILYYFYSISKFRVLKSSFRNVFWLFVRFMDMRKNNKHKFVTLNLRKLKKMHLNLFNVSLLILKLMFYIGQNLNFYLKYKLLY